jgi:hypothetical protein
VNGVDPLGLSWYDPSWAHKAVDRLDRGAKKVGHFVSTHKQAVIAVATIVATLPLDLTGAGEAIDAGVLTADAAADVTADVVTDEAADATSDTLFSAGGQSVAGEGSGSTLPMNWDSVNAVSEKYGIDLSENELNINNAIAGARGSTAPDGTISLYRGAFDNEETLAKTLMHEQFHVGQLAEGMDYPDVYDPYSPWEIDAENYASDWWTNHTLNQ